jgi:hypothetical protein
MMLGLNLPQRRRPPQCVVAIPAKNEADRLPACLAAFEQQRDALGRDLSPASLGVLVLANDCEDDSAALARHLLAGSRFEWRVIEASLPRSRAHAGGARREAMDLAAAWLRESGEDTGVILTTDADSRVAPDWVCRNMLAFAGGIDAVFGCISLDEEGDLLPAALHRRGRLEGAYEALLTELSAVLDPLDHNPWPTHATISAASLAVTAEAYRRIGGLPCVPLGEDKAFGAELLQRDGKIRFCPEVQVVTSGRIYGRAPGGVADTLRLRSQEPGAYCDEALEPFRIAIKRAKWRSLLRARFDRRGSVGKEEWPRGLHVCAQDARRISMLQSFGAAWNAIEIASPLLQKRLLAPSQLPVQIAGARRALARLREKHLSARQHVEAETLMALTTKDLGALGDPLHEKFGSLVAS